MKKKWIGRTVAMAALLGIVYFTACNTGSTPPPSPPPEGPTVVSHTNLTHRIPVPAEGITPLTVHENEQYSLAITWTAGGNLHTGPFVLGTVYSAAAVITVKTGFTLTGLTANSFSHTYAQNINYDPLSSTVFLAFPTAAPPGLTDFNLSGKFASPLNRRVPERAFNSSQYNGTIAWYRVAGGINLLIDEKEIFSSDTGSSIRADLTLSANGSYHFSSLSGNFTFTGASLVTVNSASGNSASVSVTFAPIPEPDVVSSWRRGGDGNDANPVPNVTDLFWMYYYNDGTFMVFNSDAAKAGNTIAAEGEYTVAGSADGMTVGDNYTLDISWIDAYAALHEEIDRKDIPAATILANTYVGDDVQGPKQSIGNTSIAGNKTILGNIIEGNADGRLRFALTRRWHDTPDPHVNYALYEPPPPPVFVTESGQAGELIRLTAFDSAYAAVSNNRGMSGGRIGRIHFHDNNTANMFSGSRRDFIFDIGHIDQLGELHIWNHNGGTGADGLRDVTVSYSNDNAAYTNLGSFTLKRASGAARLSATNLADDSFINFGGISARYIRISPQDNNGNWGGQFGLSEVRLFRYRNEVYRGAYIAASPIYNVRTTLPAPAYYNLTNGAGLSHPTSDNALHSNNPDHMFFTSGSTGTFDIDLHGRYPVQKVVIWNYNGAGNTNRGLSTVTVSASDGNIHSTNPYQWSPIVSNQTITAGTGNNGMGPSATVQMNNTMTRFIRISGSAISGSQSGLSAIRVYVGEGMYIDYLNDWTALFMHYPQDRGWGGADGIYSTNLDGKDYDPGRNPNDKRTFFIFSDTVNQNVDQETGIRYGGWGMPNNTRGTLTGGSPLSANMTFNTNAISPPGGMGIHFYWLGDTFVVGDKLYIYTVNEVNFGGGWDFEQIGVHLVRYDIVNNQINESSRTIITNNTDGRLYNVTEGTSGSANRWHLGCAVFVNTAHAGALTPDNWIYVYGYHEGGSRRIIAARVRPENVENFNQYQYLWNDDTWRNEPWGSSRANPKLISNYDPTTEFSVTEIRSGPNKGRFLHIFSETSLFSSDWLQMSISTTASPVGPFTTAQNLYRQVTPHNTIPTQYHENLYVYNAKAHPALSTDDELVVSYNVNGSDAHGDIYRPRFMRYAQVPLTPGN
ncbi:MAG: DUF4185 domain-containing protein [Treponema sp.]|nr:DUF4185 domain-containing protein [Treponema sp.]